jgi:probable rRNA maturation factor
MSSDGLSRSDAANEEPPEGATVLFRKIPSRLSLSGADKRALRSFACALSAEVAGHERFVCLITDDRALRQLNQSFLGRDYPTDVLSFPSEAEGLGEIAISIERAQEQAEQFGHSCLDEFRILMLHGVLHLMGMDHESDNGEMAAAERSWRERFQLPATLIDRVAGKEPAV